MPSLQNTLVGVLKELQLHLIRLHLPLPLLWHTEGGDASQPHHPSLLLLLLELRIHLSTPSLSGLMNAVKVQKVCYLIPIPCILLNLNFSASSRSRCF